MAKSGVLAVDLGGTKIAGAIVGEDLKILWQKNVPSRESIEGIADPELRITRALITELNEYANNHGILLKSGCAGFPEYVNLEGQLTTRDNIDWRVQPQEDFAELTGFPWIAQSDVRCAGIAEARIGAGKGLPNFVYLTISSGISHTSFLRGEPVTGPNGEAIGFGLLEIEAGGEKYLLENYCSGLGIARRYARKSGAIAGDAKIVLSMYESVANAKEIVDTATLILGREIALFAEEQNMNICVMGGGLWLGSEKYRSLTLESLRLHSLKNQFEISVINASVENSGVIGAAIYAFAAEESTKI